MTTLNEERRGSVLITGSTGTVGSEVSDQFESTTVQSRIASRTPSRLNVDGTNSVSVEFDFERPETWNAALVDVDQLFLVRPPKVSVDWLKKFVDAAIRMGTEHIVYLSVLGAEKNPLLPHSRMESHLKDADVTYTFLRAANFMQNFSEIHRLDIIEHDEVFVPAGGGKTGFVDARDVAAVGVTALTEPGHENCAYNVTGPAALDCYHIADVFTDVLGRQVTYPNPSILAFGRRMRSRDVPYPMIGVMIALYTITRIGFSRRVSDDVDRVLGRKARSFRAFVESYADCFRQ